MMAILATWRPLLLVETVDCLKVLVKAWEAGCKFDGWTEFFNYETWLKAFADCGLDPAYFARRTRDFDEPLPLGSFGLYCK